MRRGIGKFKRFLDDNHFDVIISTHVFGAILVNELKKRTGQNYVSAFVLTDYTCCPGAYECKANIYFTPHPALTEEFVSAGIEKDRVVPSGIPVSKHFTQIKNKTEIRAELSLPTDRRIILVGFGSMGCGPIKELLKQFQLQIPDNCHISVVCGTNERLRKNLEQEHKAHPRIHIYGYRKDIPMMMDSADLYLTKPGGISTSEAASKNLPMVFVNAVAGCETYNMNFFVQRGSAVTAETPEELATLTLSLLANDDQLKQMSLSFNPFNPGAAADIICDDFINTP